MDADGSHQHRVLDSPEAADLPEWSPDGILIACSGGTIVKADGTGVVHTTAAWLAPAWSPGGTRIAFSRWTSIKSLELYMANVDGSEESNIPLGALITFPNWRPRR